MTDRTPGAPGWKLVTGKAFAHRSGINVIYCGASQRLNWGFARGTGPILESVRRAVRAVIEHDKPGWSQRYPRYLVTVRPDPLERGTYHYTVTADPVV